MASREAAATRPDGVQKATGRTRDEWFELLDVQGMRGRPYKETAAYLVGDHGLSRWWAQKLTVEYEQARGVRTPGARPDGTITVTATKTVAVPHSKAFDAVADATQRRRWLRDLRLRSRGSDGRRSIRFDSADGSRVKVTFHATSENKVQVAVEHSRISTARAASREKTAWRDRLAALREVAES